MFSASKSESRSRMKGRGCPVSPRPQPAYANAWVRPSRVKLAALVASLGVGIAIAPSAYAAFPGTNGSIAFTYYSDSDSDIFSMDGAGGNVDPLTANTTPEYDPAWSANGRWIAYTCYEGSAPQVCKMRGRWEQPSAAHDLGWLQAGVVAEREQDRVHRLRRPDLQDGCRRN